MKFICILFLLCVCSLRIASAQEPQTIHVKKESDLSKVVFDNTELKLMVVDRFGNPRENKIASYKLFVKGRRETREFAGYGNRLSHDMVDCLNKLSSATKIFFTEISVRDDDDHLVKLPDVIDVWFPDCVNCKRDRGR